MKTPSACFAFVNSRVFFFSILAFFFKVKLLLVSFVIRAHKSPPMYPLSDAA